MQNRRYYVELRISGTLYNTITCLNVEKKIGDETGVSEKIHKKSSKTSEPPELCLGLFFGGNLYTAVECIWNDTVQWQHNIEFIFFLVIKIAVCALRTISISIQIEVSYVTFKIAIVSKETKRGDTNYVQY